MPTSSTAKIAASKPKPDQPQGIYSRHRRPKSCKYDTYRLRSRISAVDESLFGEPLKNKLIMARSRSMEAISNENNEENEPPALFTKRGSGPPPGYKHLCPRDDVKRQERPRTALATMRTSGNAQCPEFERRSSGQGGEPGIVRVVSGNQVKSIMVHNGNQTLVLSRFDFDKIRKAAKIMTAAEKDEMRREQELAKEAALKAASDRKADFEKSASFHNTPDETEIERESKLRDHHLIERANDLKMEQLQEIKKLNQHIIQVKCHAIRDVQLEEKQKKWNDLVEAERSVEEQIEIERKQAEEMEANRALKTVDFNKEFRLALDVQKAEIEAQKLLEREKFEAELMHRKMIEDALKEQEAKEAEAKRLKTLEMQAQMLIDMEETKKRKEIEAEMAKLHEERILALQNERRQAEIRKEEEAKKAKRDRERDMMRMKAAVEKEQELKMKREELRLLRQQEIEDRKWRQREVEVARLKAQREEELRRVRVEQMRQREEIAAKSVERDKQHWDEVRQMWQSSVNLDKEHQEMRSKAKRHYLTDLQSQMAARADMVAKMKQNHQAEAQMVNTERETLAKRIQNLREKKLQQLKAYNVPEKYIKEIERKCQMDEKSKFTYSYFGLK